MSIRPEAPRAEGGGGDRGREAELRGRARLSQQRRLRQATQFLHKDSADLLPLDGLKRLGTSKDWVRPPSPLPSPGRLGPPPSLALLGGCRPQASRHLPVPRVGGGGPDLWVHLDHSWLLTGLLPWLGGSRGPYLLLGFPRELQASLWGGEECWLEQRLAGGSLLLGPEDQWVQCCDLLLS